MSCLLTTTIIAASVLSRPTKNTLQFLPWRWLHILDLANETATRERSDFGIATIAVWLRMGIGRHLWLSLNKKSVSTPLVTADAGKHQEMNASHRATSESIKLTGFIQNREDWLDL